MTSPQWPGPRGDRDGDTERNMSRFNVLYVLAIIIMFALMHRFCVAESWKRGMQSGFALGFVIRGEFPL